MKYEKFISSEKIEYKTYETKHGKVRVRESTTNPENAIAVFDYTSYKIKKYDDEKVEKFISNINNTTSSQMFIYQKTKNLFGHKKQLLFSRGEDESDLRVETKTNGSVLFYSDSKYLMYPALKYQEKVKSTEEAIDKVNDNDEGLSLGFKIKSLSKTAISDKHRYHR